MSQEPEHQQVDLPLRREISLCEAVTAIAHGRVMDVGEYISDPSPETETQATAARAVIERLQAAAYAGDIKFRALREGDRHSDEPRIIDSYYFREKRGFQWSRDRIWSHDRPPFKPEPPKFTLDWIDVHLNRLQFEEWRRKSGSPVESTAPDSQAQHAPTTTYSTGAPGRPSSAHLVEAEAQRRADSGNIPDSLAQFARELASWLKEKHPAAPPMTAKTIKNKISQLYRQARLKNPNLS